MPVVRFLRRVHPAELADIITAGEAFRFHLRRYRRLRLLVFQNSVRAFISLPARLEALCTATQCLAKLIRAMHLIAALFIATHSRARQCIARQRSASLWKSIIVLFGCHCQIVRGFISLPPRSEVLCLAILCSAWLGIA